MEACPLGLPPPHGELVPVRVSWTVLLLKKKKKKKERRVRDVVRTKEKGLERAFRVGHLGLYTGPE